MNHNLYSYFLLSVVVFGATHCMDKQQLVYDDLVAANLPRSATVQVNEVLKQYGELLAAADKYDCFGTEKLFKTIGGGCEPSVECLVEILGQLFNVLEQLDAVRVHAHLYGQINAYDERVPSLMDAIRKLMLVILDKMENS